MIKKRLLLLAVAGWAIEAVILWAFGVDFLALPWWQQYLLVVAPALVTSRVIFYKRNKELTGE